MRKKFICGNWKMNGTLAEAHRLASRIDELWDPKFERVTVAVCPPFAFIPAVIKDLEDSSIAVGAQVCSAEKSGAYTGEVSASMLKDIGCSYVILGHSERRTLFGETDELVSRKVREALDAGLKPIVCIGETEQERDRNETESVLRKQISGSLATISLADAPTLTIAYEPVWAIGTGKTATPRQAQDAHLFIRSELRTKFGDIADNIIIQYGGSMKPENAYELLSSPDIDGGLIGGASLDAEAFIAIIDSAARLSQ